MMPALQKLMARYQRENIPDIRDLFKQDPDRAARFSIRIDGLLADFSKTSITPETLKILCEAAREAGLEQRRDDMFNGIPINTTEKRAVLHTALRAPDGGGHADVLDARAAMRRFTDEVRKDKKYSDIVNIGIGGSSLGPECVAMALRHEQSPDMRLHFVSNVEASDLDHVLRTINPAKTLFLIASKTFTTAETMQNAAIAKSFMTGHLGQDAVRNHFAALCANPAAARAFGIADNRIFPFAEWVGGRYSVWSSIGLSIMLAIGADKFDQFLQGAHAADQHFRQAPLEKNIPVLMALTGIWHRNICSYPAYACIPYHAGLRRFPAWLQQLDMESSGKHAKHKTGPIVFGEPGTDAQHSFFQWLHQGTDIVPVDFIAAVKTETGTEEQQRMLLANCLAQSSALMLGRSNTQEPHRDFKGNRPSTTLLLDQLTPCTLGLIMAMYEHKIFVQGVMWGINSFDQWGVELGKTVATDIAVLLKDGTQQAPDPSTAALARHIQGL